MKSHGIANEEELIKALRWCGSEDERHEMCVDETYRCPMWNEDRMTDYCKADLMLAAAAALEAADEKIADYTAAINALDDSNDAYIKENERLKKRIARLEEDLKTREAEREVMRDTIKICEETADRYKAQMPKEGEWKWNSLLNEYEWVDNTIYCQICGAIMRGEHDED